MEQNREPRNKRTHKWSIYNKGGKNIQWDKDSLVHKWHWENWASTYKNKTGPLCYTTHQKINSESTKEPKTRSHWPKRKCKAPWPLSQQGLLVFFLVFFVFDTKGKGSKSKTKWNYIKVKSFSVQQGKPSIKWTGSLKNGRQHLQITYLMDLYPKNKQFRQLNS